MTAVTTDAAAGTSATPETEAIIAEIAPHLWFLWREGEVRAALLLLRNNADRYNEAWRKEYAGIALPGKVVREVTPGCTSPHHDGLNCATALAAGRLEEGVSFCEYCSAQQVDMEPAPTVSAETGGLVHIVSQAAGDSRVRRKAS